jgi:acyl carrier protein phosphodiesterase
MNYLAHAYLSSHQEALMVGNFIADHVRGTQLQAYPDEIQQGIRMHRAIDAFTDAHSEFKSCKRLFYKGFEKHSGVLVDIYFDYFLASEFHLHSSTPLKEFAEKTYHVYLNHQHHLPPFSARFLEYVLKHNIYAAYASKEGIEKVLYHLSHRINHGIQLNESITLLDIHRQELHERFSAFFKELKQEFLPNPFSSVV